MAETHIWRVHNTPHASLEESVLAMFGFGPLVLTLEGWFFQMNDMDEPLGDSLFPHGSQGSRNDLMAEDALKCVYFSILNLNLRNCDPFYSKETRYITC